MQRGRLYAATTARGAAARGNGQRREKTGGDVASRHTRQQSTGARSCLGLWKDGAVEEGSCWLRGDRRMASVHLRRLPLQEGSGLRAALRLRARQVEVSSGTQLEFATVTQILREYTTRYISF